jgi:L-aminopeptidase/D-esterase-like protein
MTGGIGYAELTLANGAMVLAYAVVNSLGDVRDVSGQIIAGARLKNGEFADCEKYLLAGQDQTHLKPSNSTLVFVATNVDFSKIELKRIAKVALSGMARAISPVFTRYDGDLLFCVSMGTQKQSEESISVMAAFVVRQAIMNAVKESKIIEVRA